MEQALSKARDAAGGAARLAAAIFEITGERISPQAIGQWKLVPPARVLVVERISGVSRHELRPDIYGALPAAYGALPAAGLPPCPGLTRRQRDAMLAIQRGFDATGIMPSFAEIAAALGLASKGGVQRLILGLEARGYLRRAAYKPRALTMLMRVPDLPRPDDLPCTDDLPRPDDRLRPPSGPRGAP